MKSKPVDLTLTHLKGGQALFGNGVQVRKEPAIILKAKDLAAEITSFNTWQHKLTTEAAISVEHIANNDAVRNTLLERGIRPEALGS